MILTVLLALGVIAAVSVLVRVVVVGETGPSLVAIVAWAIWTLVLFCLVGLVDVYRHVPWTTRVALFIWGAGVASLVSMLAETVVDPLLPFGGSLGPGLVEEGTKILGVILFAALAPVLFLRPMGGLICGMMVGLGFSFLENIFYANAAISGPGTDPGAVSAGYVSFFVEFGQRGFLDGAGWHLVFTGLAGLGVSYFMRHRDRGAGSRWAGALAFIIGAVLLHFLWDLGSSIQNVAGAILVNTLNIFHFVLVALLIVYAVRAERRWLSNATAGAEPVIESEERPTLRKHATRRRARAAASDAGARERTKTRQWAQIGYVDATADGAPETETDRLARYVSTLRQPTSRKVGRGDVPSQRQPAPSEEQQPTRESPN